ncbi:MAG: PKD domain-containing protein [Bacteroidota bacterium]
MQTFTVPCGVFSVNVKAWGGGGSGGGSDSYIGAPGGGGGFVQTDLAVVPGQILTIVVAGGGGPGGNCAGGAPGGAGGWGNGVIDGGRGGNAGASGCSGGGGAGGGASAIYAGATTLLVAGGGGGGSGGGNTSAGGAGGGSGINGNTGSGCSVGIAGASANGIGDAGGDRGGADGAGGGGGGGGYNGGSGGGAPPGCDCGGCGGGGGNSFSSGTNIVITNGNGQASGNDVDPNLPAGAATGGYGSAGGNGFVLFTFDEGPFADYSFTTVCENNAVQFTNSSTTDAGTLTTMSWDFGDNSSLNNTLSPSHLYADGGNYNVTLIVNNSLTCADTITKAVQVYHKPVAVFSAADVCLGDSINFTNTSTINPASSISVYSWKFGDAGTSGLPNPAHYYAAGTFQVELITTTPDNCADTATLVVNTFDAPTSAFSSSSTCLFDSAKFTNSSLNPVMGNLANYYWDFGDGTPINSTVWNPRHLYTAPGNYVISLITQSSNLGCPDTMKVTITVYPMPVANFNSTDVCLHQSMVFSDQSTGTNTSWSWNFGDTTPLNTTQNPGHTYASPGTYSVTLIVTSTNGCKDTIVKSVIVHPLPIALYNAANVCDGNQIQFNDFSTLAFPDLIQTYLWNFGDGSSDNSQNTFHLYPAAGSYTAQLLVISDFGCQDSISKTVFVNPNPIVNFTADDTLGCDPLCVAFQNSSSIISGSNVQSAWDFGDGSPLSTSQDVSHCYTTASVYAPVFYSPSLTIISDSGCVTSMTKNGYITVVPNPEAQFTADPLVTNTVNPVVSITDMSIGADFWSWDYGDFSGIDTASFGFPVPHNYVDTGTYLITLITATQFGCFDTAYQTVVVEPEFIFYVPNAFSPNEDGINDSFTCTGTFVVDFKMTIFDRWGNLVYRTDSIDEPWDGKANYGAEVAQRDVYVYRIEITDIKKKKHDFKGIVTLVK